MANLNSILRALQSGVLSYGDLAPEDIASLQNVAVPQPDPNIAPMVPNTMRAENGPNAGQVTNLNFSGQPGTPQAAPVDLSAMRAAAQAQFNQQSNMPNLSLSGQGGPQVMPQGGAQMRVVGSGNGQTVDLGTQPMGNVSLDYTRGQVDVPGVGRGYYGKDGNAYVQNPDGSVTKALLGYDMAGSMALSKYALEQQKAAQDITASKQQVAASQEQVAASQQSRQFQNLQRYGVPGGALPQATLEGQYGKAGEGMMWTPDGKQIVAPGSTLEKSSLSALDSGQVALANIDELLKHPGFDSAVGRSIYKTLGAGFIPGTDTRDFEERLDQLKSGSGLQALQDLKGSGARITKEVIDRAGNALTRMGTSLSPSEFISAANEFKSIISQGMQRTAAQLSPGTLATLQQGQQSPPPQVQASNIPPAAVQYLRANPQFRTAFDMKYGQGASSQVLGQ